MAESDYVNLIAQGLKAYHDAGYMAEFDARIPDVYLGDFDYQKFYSMMAWIGLHESKQYVLNKQQVEWYAEYKKYTSAARTNDNTKCN